MVLIAGAGQDVSAWDEVIRLLPGRRCLPFSSAELCRTVDDIDAAAEQLEAHLDEAGADTFVLVGLSLGGMIATRFAAQHPERVDGLLLSGSQFRPDPRIMAVQRTLQRFVPEPWLGLSDAVDKAALLRLLRIAAASDLRDDLTRITAPSQILCGLRDVANLPASRALYRALPRATLRLVRGGGHELMTDAPRSFADAVDELL